ncbi:hypothetical protein MJG53_017614, partial [Ovis ammon polii x Ovis aries]
KPRYQGVHNAIPFVLLAAAWHLSALALSQAVNDPDTGPEFPELETDKYNRQNGLDPEEAIITECQYFQRFLALPSGHVGHAEKHSVPSVKFLMGMMRELHGMAAVLSEKKVEVFDNRNILKNSKEEKDLVSHGFQLSYFNGEVHLPNLEHNWAGIPGFFHGQEMLFLPVTSRNPEKMLSRVYRSSVAINAFVSYSKHRQKSRIPNGIPKEPSPVTSLSGFVKI